MKRLSKVFALAVLTAAILSGCVVVPYGGWGWHGGYGGGYYHHYGGGPYRRW